MSGTAQKTIIVEGKPAYVQPGFLPSYTSSRYQADDFDVTDGVLTIKVGHEKIAVHPAGGWNRVYVEEQKAEVRAA